MNPKKPFRLDFVGCAMLIGLWAAWPAHAAVLVWTNLSGGNWSVAANWNPNQVPGSADTAQINLPGTYTVTVNQDTVVGNFQVGGASSGQQRLQVIGGVSLTALTTSEIYGGTGTGTGYLTVSSGGSLSLGSSAYLYTEGPFTNAGTLNITNGYVYLYNNATVADQGGLMNLSGGQINLAGSGAILSATGPNDYFINNGTVTKLAGTGASQVTASEGVLMGTYNAASGTSILFGGGSVSAPLQPDASLVLSGSGQYQFNVGYLQYSSTTVSNLLLTTGLLTLGPGFQGGAITNLALNGITLTNTLPVTGTLAVTNSTVNGTIVVANGGVLLPNSGTLTAQVTIQNGGLFLNYGSSYINNTSSLTNNWLLVQNGGVVECAGNLYLYGPLTNNGTINVTNGYTLVANNNTNNVSLMGGIRNQAGGVIDLWNNSTLQGTSSGNEYLINRGTINMMNGSSSSINFVTVDLAGGTITTQPGTSTLQVGMLNGSGTWAGTYSAAANSIIQFVANAYPGTSPGTPLVLGGSGQYQFTGGLLTLPTDVIPGVTMTGGSLLLGPGFQGGALTNLALNGINLTNTLPVTGKLSVTSGTVVGTIVVSNTAVLNANGAALTAQVTVQSGGTFVATGTSSIYNTGSLTNNWLWVQNGGTVLVTGYFYLYGPMTNSGAVTVTNGNTISAYNGSNNPLLAGGIVNQAGGVIDLWNNSSLLGTGYGNEYLINRGTINMMDGSSSSINFTILNLGAGTITTQPAVTGMLAVQTFSGPGSLTGTYHASTNTTIQFGASGSPGTSPGTPLLLGGTGLYQFNSGFLTLSNNVVPGLALTGGTLLLGPAFEGGAITNLALNGINATNNLPLVGTMTMTNGYLYGSLVISNGAVFTSFSAALEAQVTVLNGGELVTIGNTYIYDVDTVTNNWLLVQAGGLVQEQGYLYLYGPVTNSGTINVTNGFSINAFNSTNNPAYNGGIVNQSGGIIDLWVNSLLTGTSYGNEYLINRGTINMMNGYTGSINFNRLDLGAGTITTQPAVSGSLSVGAFSGVGGWNGTYNAAANTTIQFGASLTPGTSPGTPLVLGGAGQYLFNAGFLTLTTNVVPGVALTGGTLLLGPGFQGGAITNLVLNGITLTNTLPMVGTFDMTNGTVYTTSPIASGSQVYLTGATVIGTIVVGNGVLLQVNGATLTAQVTVQAGGELSSVGSTDIYNTGSLTNNWLLVQSGGLLQAAGYFYLYGPLTNSGTINLTNGFTIGAFNNASPAVCGGIVNQPGGVINLWNNSSLSGTSYGSEYLFNQGEIAQKSGNSFGYINFSYLTNSGVFGAYHGNLQIQSPRLGLLPSGTWLMGLNSLADYGQFSIPGVAPLSGTLLVSLQNGYVPALGSFFTVISYGSKSSDFTGFNLPGVLPNVWQPGYSSTALTLGLVPAIVIEPPGTNVLIGVNGSPGHQAILISSPSVAVPRSSWTPVQTNIFDVTGYLGITIPIDNTKPQFYYTFRLP